MKLTEVLSGIETASRIGEIEIGTITNSLKEVRPGALFVCTTSSKMLPRAFLAVLRGAKAIICERRLPLPVPQVLVKDAWEAQALACANYHGRPAEHLTMIGVTGTNGKTSTTHMIRDVLEHNGIRTGLIGTIRCLVGDEELEATITTPTPMKLHELLKYMLEKGCRAVVMEVSSEALAQHRVAGIRFNVGVFTNLTQDHLHCHGTMARYAAAKRRLFAQCDSAAFNVDAEYCAFMSEGFAGTTLTYGVTQPADVSAKDAEYFSDRIAYDLSVRGTSCPVEIRIPGRFSVYNSLACAAACSLLGLSAKSISAGMGEIRPVPGRIERLPTPGLPFAVILDFAHTPDGLENILRSVRDFTEGRIITVFGCGGNCDKTKRPLMGFAAGQYSDYCVVTTDNPRNEDPAEIIQAILPGLRESGCAFEIVTDRIAAIEKGLRLAEAGDTVVIAGKGHEQYQEIRGVRRPFDERAVVQEAAEKIRSEKDSDS